MCKSSTSADLAQFIIRPRHADLFVYFSIRSTVTFSRPGMFSDSMPESIQPSGISPLA
jgi:hypothetical protein